MRHRAARYPFIGQRVSIPTSRRQGMRLDDEPAPIPVTPEFQSPPPVVRGCDDRGEARGIQTTFEFQSPAPVARGCDRPGWRPVILYTAFQSPPSVARGCDGVGAGDERSFEV